MQHSNPTEKYFFIIGFLLTTIGLFYLVVLAATSYKVDSGATATIDEWDVCKKVTNNNSLAIFVPTNTSDEWAAFRNNATGVSLAECGYYCDEDGDGHYAETIADTCPSGRESTTAGDDCDDSCATCYPGSTAYTYSPDGKDQDCDGQVDETSTVTKISGYDSSCNWKPYGKYPYTSYNTACPSDCANCSSHAAYVYDISGHRTAGKVPSGNAITCSGDNYYDDISADSTYPAIYFTCDWTVYH